ncbi:MAG: hypothetical protein GF364_13295, partial [Candidatus Lokiarchaeota archaeon]|nr:hypothetical protein [Candidatus Lokiarchaeota archaeon]
MTNSNANRKAKKNPNKKIKTDKSIRKIATPYGKIDTLRVMIRNAFGVNTRKNAEIVKWLPKRIKLNEVSETRTKVAFIGDLMDMEGSRLEISEEVIEFISDCDFLVGNFEATITDRVGFEGVIYGIEQRHQKNIMSSLKDLFKPEKTYLSVANNHAGDFGLAEFKKSVDSLKDAGFHVCGWKDKPFLDINDNIRLISGTQWSNQICDYVFRLKSSDAFIKDNSFNILYPHWSNELELWPRPETVTLGREKIKEFDAILGHHSHVPQAITSEKTNTIRKIIAYGLGDFCTGLKYKKYHYGIIVKTEIGKNNDNEMVVG